MNLLRPIREILCNGILALICSAAGARGATITYQGSSKGTANILLGGSLGERELDFSSVANPGTLNTTLDTTALSLKYNSVSIVAGGGSSILNANITTGFGQTSNVVANIIFNPFSFSLSNFGTASLTPSGGGNFTLGQFSGTGTLNFSGSYSITDGVNTYNGTFLKSVVAQYNVNDDDTLYAANYPASIQIAGVGVSTFRIINYPSNSVLFSQQFGVNNVQVTISRVIVQTGNDLTLSAVPEPSTCGLMVVGLSLLCLHRGRIRLQ